MIPEKTDFLKLSHLTIHILLKRNYIKNKQTNLTLQPILIREHLCTPVRAGLDVPPKLGVPVWVLYLEEKIPGFDINL